MRLGLTYDDVQIIPKRSTISTRSICDLKTKLSKNLTIDLPIVSSPMDYVTEEKMLFEMWNQGGMGFLHRFMSLEKQCEIISNVRSKMLDSLKHCKPIIGASIGVKDDSVDNCIKLVEAGANVILIDVAHGDHFYVSQLLNQLTKIKKRHFDIIAGNVATGESTQRLIDLGVDAVRVGIGGGSLCTTRMMTGVGVPMITSIMDCFKVASNEKIPIIADGGIRYPGDVAKAIVAGADTIMLGNLLAGTYESPGEIIKDGIWPNEKLFKKFRGSASLESKINRGEKGKFVEGVSTLIDYKGKIKRILNDISDGVKSSMSYVNAHTIKEFKEKGEFIQVTNSGIIEASPHGKNNART